MEATAISVPVISLRGVAQPVVKLLTDDRAHLARILSGPVQFALDVRRGHGLHSQPRVLGVVRNFGNVVVGHAGQKMSKKS